MLNNLRNTLAEVEGLVLRSATPNDPDDLLLHKVVGLSASFVVHASLYHIPDKKFMARMWEVFKKVRFSVSSNPYPFLYLPFF
jgi:hypothetical protein